MQKKQGLIVAFDFEEQTSAFSLLEKLSPDTCAVKIGQEMFTRFGPALVEKIILQGFKVFLDLKFHDIPNTVAKACSAAADLGVWMLNVHAIGGEAMLYAASNAIKKGNTNPLLIAVTMLTSMEEALLPKIGIESSMETQVMRLATLSHSCGLDGVVCSAREVPFIKSVFSSFLTITPGIRFQENSQDDQVRVVTPLEAFQQGSDYIVVGRPITQSPQPEEVIQNILKHIPSSS